jgi:hypothetical protein
VTEEPWFTVAADELTVVPVTAVVWSAKTVAPMPAWLEDPKVTLDAETLDVNVGALAYPEPIEALLVAPEPLVASAGPAV